MSQIALLAACASPQAPALPTSTPLDLALAFPVENLPPGWTISQEMAVYQRDNLYNLVNGQAESFFAYGFERVAVQRYSKDEALLNVEIWLLASPADAFGLFTAGRSGSPAEIGAGGEADPGRRVAFWQDRFFTSLTSTRPLPEDELWAFARAVSAALPQGGEPPALLKRLPTAGLVERSEIFFHEEMSIQMEIWLGGENLLGLSQETDGVLGRYDLGGETDCLVIVEYPEAGAAGKALQALQAGHIEGLLAADARGPLLGAVFGSAPPDQARALLEEALKD